MLIDALEKIKQQTIISSIVMMILGLLMLMIPEKYDGTLINLLGYVVLLFGAVMVWNFIESHKKLSDWILFIVALLLLLLGIFVLLSGDNILKVLSVLFGILLIVDGVHSAAHAWMYARRSGRKLWGLLLGIALLLVLLGIMILNNPWWHVPHSFLKAIGGIILFASVAGLIRLILVWPVRKA